MNTTTLPGYRLFEYLLILHPHDELSRKMLQVKKECNEKYKVAPRNSTRPYLTLLHFFTHQMMEEKLLHRLRVIAMGTTPFKIELKDFGSFPSHSIYFNTTTRLPLEALRKELKTASRLMNSHPDHKPHFVEDPHFFLATKLKPWQFEQAWLEYSHRHFTGRFVASEMALLRRTAAGESYKTQERFSFQNLPVATKQGILF